MRGTLPRRGATRLLCATALALAIVTAACTPPSGTTPAATTVTYGGQSFEYRAAVPYGAGYEETKYDLWLPLTGQVPLVVFVHGGFWTNTPDANRTSLPPQVKDLLLLHGYAVASIDYRGWTQTCYSGGGNCASLQILGDVKAAISHIAFVNAPSRVLADDVNLVGFSAGGHLALMAAMTVGDPSYPSSNGLEVRPATVTAIGGPTDLEALWDASAPVSATRAGLSGYTGGFRPTNTSHSPIGQTAPAGGTVDPPVNLIYSTGDTLIPPSQMTAMADAATLAGIPVTTTLLTGFSHDALRLQVDTIQLAAWLATH
jgi:acetyl esterase/lipase